MITRTYWHSNTHVMVGNKSSWSGCGSCIGLILLKTWQIHVSLQSFSETYRLMLFHVSNAAYNNNCIFGINLVTLTIVFQNCYLCYRVCNFDFRKKGGVGVGWGEDGVQLLLLILLLQNQLTIYLVMECKSNLKRTR